LNLSVRLNYYYEGINIKNVLVGTLMVLKKSKIKTQQRKAIGIKLKSLKSFLNNKKFKILKKIYFKT
jgi:hypothetical protein